MKNQWGPKQDIILGKMGGKAIRTNVAGGMSGSPVYIDGKLIGAVALRLSTFSPDAICGITPIELMLEINDFDPRKPEDARTPDKIGAAQSRVRAGRHARARLVAAGATGGMPPQMPMMVPIETPLAFSGFSESTLREFGPLFQQMGIHGGAGRRGHGRHADQQAGGGLGAFAESGRIAWRACWWIGRYERHRPGHRDLQRRQEGAGVRPSVLQPGTGGYADDARAKC